MGSILIKAYLERVSAVIEKFKFIRIKDQCGQYHYIKIENILIFSN